MNVIADKYLTAMLVTQLGRVVNIIQPAYFTASYRALHHRPEHIPQFNIGQPFNFRVLFRQAFFSELRRAVMFTVRLHG
ncbi:Uncharacterised protein [Shigella sonnei]|nr:Uncharacterised protein [Shigella sonnei]CSQ81027.1 Uncharacterised protein [Shigella sonnei]